MSTINRVAPVKQLRIKQRTEPWVTSDILTLISQRDRAFKQYKQCKSSEHFTAFKQDSNHYI